MNIINLKGTYREIGEQHGARIKGFFQPPPISQKKLALSQKCETLVKQYTPGLLNEIESFADTAEINQDQFKAFLITLGLEPGCSVIILSPIITEYHVPVFARNYDWDITFQKYFTAYITEPKGGIRSLSFCDHMIGRYGGVNKEGVAVTIHAVPAYTGKPKPGVRMNLTLRWILDNMKTTDEAVDFITETPHMTAHIYMIADKQGNMAKVEYAPEKFKVIYGDEFLSCTNRYQTTEMKQYESEDFDFGNTDKRIKNIENWRQSKSHFTHKDIMHLLSNHEDGVCNHGEYMGVDFGTIWSWIAPLGTSKAYVCEGPPCTNKYVEVAY